MLSRKQLYDYCDIDPWELKLIRVGHSLWRLLRLERRSLGQAVGEQLALQRGLPIHRPSPTNRETESLEEAIQIIVRLKKLKRIELKALRAARGEEARGRLAKLRAGVGVPAAATKGKS
jgi:hypothetical protein